MPITVVIDGHLVLQILGCRPPGRVKINPGIISQADTVATSDRGKVNISISIFACTFEGNP